MTPSTLLRPILATSFTLAAGAATLIEVLAACAHAA